MSDISFTNGKDKRRWGREGMERGRSGYVEGTERDERGQGVKSVITTFALNPSALDAKAFLS